MCSLVKEGRGKGQLMKFLISKSWSLVPRVELIVRSFLSLMIATSVTSLRPHFEVQCHSPSVNCTEEDSKPGASDLKRQSVVFNTSFITY